MLALYIMSALLLLAAHCESIPDVGDRAASPFGIEKLCSDSSLLLTNKKLLCILCKGWNPTCWSTTTPSTTKTTTEKITNQPSITTKLPESETTESPAEQFKTK